MYSKYVNNVLKKQLPDEQLKVIDESYKITMYQLKTGEHPQGIIDIFIDSIMKEHYEICEGIKRALTDFNKQNEK